MNTREITVDVREDLKRGRPPLDRILSAVRGLAAGASLRLIAPFKPTPLLDLLQREGFSHTGQETVGGDWEVVFTRDSALETEPAEAEAAPENVLLVDARGLEPPEPMRRILEAAETLPAGAELLAHTDRLPVFLLEQLTARGFVHRSEAQSDDSYLTHITRG